MEFVDLKLQKNSDDIYDLVLTEDGDFETVNSFETAVIMSLFCERRADESEVSSPEKRRGWWGNAVYQEIDTYEMGSKNWIYSQSRLTIKTANAIENSSKEALQWIVDEGYAKQVIVTSQLFTDRLLLNVKIVRFNDVESYAFTIWNNTEF